MNDEASIEAARPVAEQFRNALASALKAEGGEWRSLDLQVGLATGIIASAIQAAKLEAYEEAAKVCDDIAAAHVGDHVGMLCAEAIRIVGKVK